MNVSLSLCPQKKRDRAWPCVASRSTNPVTQNQILHALASSVCHERRLREEQTILKVGKKVFADVCRHGTTDII
jgi:hypothetical protein